MEKIKKSYKEIQDIEILSKEYLNCKKELGILSKEIASEKEELESIDLNSISSRISLLQSEYESITLEIEMDLIKSNECKSIHDLEKILEKSKENDLCFEKSAEYLKNLIISYNMKNETLPKSIKKLLEEDYSKVLKINKDIEKLIDLTAKKDFGIQIKNEFKSVIFKELNGSVPMEIIWLIDNLYIYMIFPMKSESFIFNDKDAKFFNNFHANEFHANEVVNPQKILKDFPKTADSIFHLLKENLNKRVVSEELCAIDIDENNKTLKGSVFEIPNSEEYILDVMMKAFTSEVKKPVSSEKITKSFQVFISENFSIMKKCLKLYKRSNSNRKDKALKVIKNGILKFFTNNYETIEENFILYSDLCEYLNNSVDNNDVYNNNDANTINNNINNINNNIILDDTKESLIHKIITISSKIDLDLTQTQLMLKVQIKQIHFEFTELLEKYVHKKMKQFLLIEFLNKLFLNFIKFVVRVKNYTKNEKEKIVDVLKYLQELAYDEEKESISNYPKIVSLEKILLNTLPKIKEMYENSEIALDKYELKMLIKMLFESSIERNEFLIQIQ